MTCRGSPERLATPCQDGSKDSHSSAMLSLRWSNVWLRLWRGRTLTSI